MESLTIEIINPKAKKLLKSLVDLNLISISNSSSDEEEWDRLSQGQREGIVEALDSINAGKSIPHSEVVLKMNKMING
nr:hypothetical protein [uncultured Pedobacter sp.]